MKKQELPKSTFVGILNGQKTKVTFSTDEATAKLSQFCEKYKADITTFKKQI